MSVVDVVAFALSYKLFTDRRSPNRSMLVVSSQSTQKNKPHLPSNWCACGCDLVSLPRVRVSKYAVMSLFLFGVKRISASQEQAINDEESLPSHMPSVAESVLGRVELDAISSSGVGKLADPSPSACKKRKMRGKYVR